MLTRKELFKKPLNHLCAEAMQYLGDNTKLVGMSTRLEIIGTAGIHQSTNDRMALNQWTNSIPNGGFGVVPVYNRHLVFLWCSERRYKMGDLGSKVLASPSVQLFGHDAHGRHVIGRTFCVPVSDGLAYPAGPMSGGYRPGVVNSGLAVIERTKPVPVGGWWYYVTIDGEQTIVTSRWA